MGYNRPGKRRQDRLKRNKRHVAQLIRKAERLAAEQTQAQPADKAKG